MVSSDIKVHQVNGQAALAQDPVYEEAGLLDILAVARRRFWLIAFGIAVGLSLGALHFFQATPLYTSSIQILVMPKDSNLPSESGAAGGLQQKPVDDDTLATHIELFKSPRIVQQAIETGDLAKLPTLAKVAAGGGNPAALIVGGLKVSRGGEGKTEYASILKASYTGPSPDDSAAILEAVSTAYQDFLGETFQDTSAQAVELIAQAKDEIGREMQQKQADYLEFRASAPLLWQGENSLNLHQERLAKAETALSGIAVRHMEIKSRLKVIEDTLAAGHDIEMSDLERLALLGSGDVERFDRLLEAGDEPQRLLDEDPTRQLTVQTEYNRLLDLRLEEKRLMEDYGDSHPGLQAVREQIALIREFLAENAPDPLPENREPEKPQRLTPQDLLSAHVGSLRHDQIELEELRGQLERMADQEQEAAKKLSVYEIQDRLQRTELDRLRELHDTVIARLREINLIKDYGGFLTEVIFPVERAGAPSSPRMSKALGLGAILGFVLGCALAYLVELSDKTFRSPEELCQTLRLPIMAHIPGTGIRRGRRHAANGQTIDPSVVAAHKPSSRFAEIFRGLRTALRFSADGSDCRVIQVTSANPRDGKTTVAANLAVSLAQAGKRVLLVDCDLRRPRVDAMFGLEPEAGLVELLAGEAELVDVVLPSGVDGLWVLPCKHKPSNPAEILSSPKFEQLIQVVREQYDIVLLDSPPVLAVSDPSVIAPRVDGVLLTVRISKHGRPEVVQAREILSSLGAKILGVVVNGSGKATGYGYGYRGKGYGYGHSYGYGYGYRYGYGYGYGGPNGSRSDNMNPYYGNQNEEPAKA